MPQQLDGRPRLVLQYVCLSRLTTFSWWDGFFGACDGNFKLRRMNVSSDLKDPSLYDGLAYFIPLATAEKWMKDREGQKQEVGLLTFAVLS
jgi:hypothetical protein